MNFLIILLVLVTALPDQSQSQTVKALANLLAFCNEDANSSFPIIHCNWKYICDANYKICLLRKNAACKNRWPCQSTDMCYNSKCIDNTLVNCNSDPAYGKVIKCTNGSKCVFGVCECKYYLLIIRNLLSTGIYFFQ